MVAFRRLFLAEKYPSTGLSAKEMAKGDVGLSTMDIQSTRTSENRPPSPRVKVAAPAEAQLEVDHHFERIERQLQEMHDSLRTRTVSRTQVPARTSSRRTKNPRHVDLLDAVFASSQRNQAQSPEKSSPVSPYSEDVAERNMTRFLQEPPRKRSLYSRFISVLNQEDGADKNATKAKDGTRSRSRNTSMRPRNASRSLNAKGHNLDNSSRSDFRDKESKTTESSPQESSRPKSRDEPVTSPNEPQTYGSLRLRSQRSAPNLSTDKPSPLPKVANQSPVGNLTVPPAHKQGDAWSNTPLPDSPTLPTPVKQEPSMEKQSVHTTPSATDPRSPSTTRNYSLPNRPAPSRKNTRNLSINTDLAVNGKSAKPSHRAIQPPTPSNNDSKYNPSIAEVMNSPLPSATPTSISPISANPKVAEIMDMFRQAYTSTKAVSPHPTFETLQDAIVREINSHEAFQRVPVPGPGPAFSPSPSQQSFDKNTNVSKAPITSTSGVNKNGSGKENQLTKLIKPTALKKHRRNSRSISTSVPSKVLGRVSTSGSRRRHTDAPPPSPGFLDEPAQEKFNETSQEPMPPTDLPLRSQTASPGAATKKRSVSLSKNLDNVQSPGILSLQGLKATPSVYYMRAQTSASSSDGGGSFSVEDSDDDVLQLPSPTVPTSRMQTHGIGAAYRSMNWQQLSSRDVPLSGTGSSAARFVETY